jgi:hypothetical protein
MRQFDGLHSFSTGCAQADNCNDLLARPVAQSNGSVIWPSLEIP